MLLLSRAFFLLTTLLFVATNASAVEIDGSGDASTVPESGIATEKDERPPFKYNIAAEYVPQSGLDGSDASMAYTQYSASFEMLFLLFSADHRVYDWRDGSSFSGASGEDPWKSLTRISPGLQYFQKFGDWGVWAQFVASSGFEDSITGDSWTYQPQLLGLYMPTKDWAIYFGGGWLYHPVNPVAYPVLGLAFRREEQTGLCGAIGFPETMLRYGFNEHWAIKLDFNWEILTYRLADDNALSPKGYVRIDEKVPGLFLEYSPLKGLTFAPGVRWHLDRKLTLYDDDADKIDKIDVDEAVSGLLMISYEF